MFWQHGEPDRQKDRNTKVKVRKDERTRYTNNIKQLITTTYGYIREVYACIGMYVYMQQLYSYANRRTTSFLSSMAVGKRRVIGHYTVTRMLASPSIEKRKVPPVIY